MQAHRPKPDTRRILGLDPGYGRLGFGVLDVDTRERMWYVTCGVITTAPQTPTAERLQEIARDLRTLIAQHEPSLIVIEELFFAKNVTTALKVAEVRGVIQLLAAEAGIPTAEVKPVEVKMAVTGQGNAVKTQVQKMITVLLKLEQVPSPDDAADALAIAWSGYVRRSLR